MKLKSLTYTSRAQLDLGDEDLLAIHESARHFNALNGVTGLLIFDGGRFLQIVEGPEDAVGELVERLRRDTRHSAFEVRDERHVSQRSFPDWAMELVHVGQHGEHARREVTSRLPADASPAVYDLAIRMTQTVAV
jgi:hypothetical protein